jgi:hypothetical protein
MGAPCYEVVDVELTVPINFNGHDIVITANAPEGKVVVGAGCVLSVLPEGDSHAGEIAGTGSQFNFPNEDGTGWNFIFTMQPVETTVTVRLVCL